MGVSGDTPPVRFDAVVLAGSRPDDALASRHGVPTKALIDVGGEPMLQRVLRALGSSGVVRRSLVVGSACVDPILAAARPQTSCIRLEPDSSLTGSVAAALRLADWPVLVTTADHALLGAAVVRAFGSAARDCGADLAVGLADYRQVKQRFPESARTPLRFAGAPLCGCNLFAFLEPASTGALDWWQRVEQQRKRPLRMVRQLGVGRTLAYLTGSLSVDSALRHLGQLSGCRIRRVMIEHPEAAVDVDSPRDLALCRRYLSNGDD